jgi:hypothetical protein
MYVYVCTYVCIFSNIYMNFRRYTDNINIIIPLLPLLHHHSYRIVHREDIDRCIYPHNTYTYTWMFVYMYSNIYTCIFIPLLPPLHHHLCRREHRKDLQSLSPRLQMDIHHHHLIKIWIITIIVIINYNNYCYH